jgi:dolichol-phosphate mannosyltransferase
MRSRVASLGEGRNELPTARDSASPPPDLSVVMPAHNGAESLTGLIAEVDAALRPTGLRFELVVVDDGSDDGTADVLAGEMAAHEWLIAVRLCATRGGSGNGQSTALYAGLQRARGELVALLDADGQNDPADLPAMIEWLKASGADLIQGDRSSSRRDSLVRRASSRVGQAFRRVLLGDSIRDTGCSLRVFKREVGLALPLRYEGMHRFIPIHARWLGYVVVEFPVTHRPRAFGSSKYGILNRALPALRDLLAARWMRSRLRDLQQEPIEPSDRLP